MAPLDPTVLAGLVGVVGDEHVLTEPDLVAGHATDWTGRFRGSTPAVVRPGTTDEVAAVLRLCAEFGVPLVPQGGNTGLVGGATPLEDEVVLSLSRLRSIEDVDRVMGQVTVGAGVTVATAAELLHADGWTLGVDLASRDTATVGGAVATDAGGLHVLRWGTMRRQVLGLEAVRSDGTVISRLGGLPKDNAGYDLPELLCGSEGTLAVITRVRLGLVPRPEHRATALLGLASLADAVAVVGALRRSVPGLDLAEVMLADGVALVSEHRGWPAPLSGDPAVYLAVEAGGTEDPVDALAAAVEGSGVAVGDVAVASDSAGRERLIRHREGHTEAINAVGIPRKLDLSVPFGELAGLVDQVRAWADEQGARAIVFGHLGDAGIHVNLLGAEAEAGDHLEDRVFRLAVRCGGSISAEHGIGRAKRRWYPLARSEADRAASAAVRQALDPAGILNPGVPA